MNVLQSGETLDQLPDLTQGLREGVLGRHRSKIENRRKCGCSLCIRVVLVIRHRLNNRGAKRSNNLWIKLRRKG
ncbi:hypothetical protein G6F57_019165 [Rhizopus arrhizus]|nr:hypothetical protein G6F57_019165 [Rhizopus arrhizus]